MRFPAFRSFFIFFLFLVSTFYFLPSVAWANTTSQANQPQSTTSAYPVSNTNPDVPNNLHNWTQNVMIEVMSAMTCQLAGVDPTNPSGQCLGVDQKTGKIGFVENGGGAIGVMGNMISVLYTPPAHTGDYFQNLASNFGIGKKAYAQGVGFKSLSPLMNIWTAFRNITYLIFVIVFVGIGLAIMLRVKIDPRTVMTIQNQIPKIIVGIILVTFSFAIAGFLIDLMWVLIYLTFGLISGIPGTDLNVFNPAAITGQNALRVAGHISTSGIPGITWNAGDSMLGVATDLLGLGLVDKSFMNILIHALSVGAGFFVAFFTEGFKVIGFTVPGVQEAIKGGAAAGIVEGGLRWAIPFVIAYLIIFIALLTALFRLWFSLLSAFINILLDIVLAPFWITAGLIPGSPYSFSGWLRSMTANLLAFPTVIVMFLLGKVFMDSFGCPNPAIADLAECQAGLASQFVPPLIGTPGIIAPLIGIGTILLTPNVVNALKSALKVPKNELGGIGKTIGAGVGVVTGTTKSSIGAGAAYVMGDPLTGKKGAEGLRVTLQRKFFG